MRKEKISFNCGVPKENIISAPDEKILYKIPLNFEKEKLGEKILKALGLPRINADSKRIKTDRDDPYISVSNPNKSVGKNNPHKSVLNPYLSVAERHRHRYEVNPKFYEILQNKGLIFSGIHRLTPPQINTDKHRLNNMQFSSPESAFLVEIIELPEKVHPFFLGTQFHPEFKSRFLHPHPIFLEFIKKSSAKKR